MNIVCLNLLALFAVLGGGHVDTGEATSWRQPIGLHLFDDHLFVAERLTGRVAIVDVTTQKVVDKLEVGGRLEAMTGVGDRLFLADGDQDRLVCLCWQDGRLAATVELQTGRRPIQLVASRDGAKVWVSLRQDKAVECWDLLGRRRVRTVKLDFAPHCIALTPDEKTVLVADAFRGRISALDAESGAIVRTFEFPGTNIRGLAVAPNGEHYYFSHQILSEKSMITREAIFWGALITNNLRRVPMTAMLDAEQNPLGQSQLHYLGDAHAGAGDPGAIAVTPDGTLVVCLAGVGQVAIDRDWPFSFYRVQVGKRPSTLAVSPDGKTVYAANTFDDSITAIHVAKRTALGTWTLGEPAKLTAAQRGEVLFHDARLSHDGWFSCHSCHTEGHTNGVNADTFGDASYGAPKNTPTLFGVAHTGPWGWTGRFDRLADQVHNSITKTMLGGEPSEGQLSDLAAFLETLEPPKLAEPKNPLAAKGREIFRREGCTKCHSGGTFTTDGAFDVGLDDGLAGNTHFNPPSLRLVGETAPYFHDGRAQSLREVFSDYQHQLSGPLPESDLAALLAFLESL